jgi:hypothetical protein
VIHAKSTFYLTNDLKKLVEVADDSLVSPHRWIALVQNSAYRGSSHRYNGATYNICSMVWFGHISRRLHWGAGICYLPMAITTCLRSCQRESVEGIHWKRRTLFYCRLTWLQHPSLSVPHLSQPACPPYLSLSLAFLYVEQEEPADAS